MTTKPTKPTKSTKRETQKEHPTNVFDVFIHALDIAYGLISSGNIIGLIVLFVLGLAFFVVYKLPAEYINSHLINLFLLLSNEKYYFIPLSGALLFSVTINIIQKKIYKNEVKRLTDNRSELIHGKEKGEMNQLKKHISSDFDITNDSE